MVVVTWQLGCAAIIDAPTLVLAIVSALALLRYRLNSVWLILIGGGAGAITTVLAH
jgi:chromate transporter